MFYRHTPQSLPGSGNPREPLLVDRDGVHLHRETLQAIQRLAAKANGSAADELGSHSLRFGGASALWAASHDSGLVKRWGRWASDCFHMYLCEDRKGASGVAASMAKTDLVPP